MMLVLFALFFRPLAFDYRSKLENPTWRNRWDWALFCGSFIPALVFGIAFGNLIQGVPISIDNLMRLSYEGSFFSLFNPFALLCGVISVSMLVAHGGIWLQLRTGEPVATRSAQYGRIALIVALVGFAVAGFWLTHINGMQISGNIDTNGPANPLAKTVTQGPGLWLSNYEKAPILMLFPALAFVMGVIAWGLSKAGKAGLGFVATSLMLLGIIVTFGVSLFPFVMPSTLDPNMSLTMWDAVSSHMTLNIMFIAVAIFLPIILGYTLWCYIKMWRRVERDEIESNSHGTY